VARLAADAEERGWHGVFVWDQLRWREPIRQVADPWTEVKGGASPPHEERYGGAGGAAGRRGRRCVGVRVGTPRVLLDRLPGSFL
jgi:hypothetical protein